ncbi:MAG TPA: hypothetical protein VE134_09400, partial [Methanomicrobiales archaeon]|nr:hypothetical protein [Methanomicrobiales archaeon]
AHPFQSLQIHAITGPAHLPLVSTTKKVCNWSFRLLWANYAAPEGFRKDRLRIGPYAVSNRRKIKIQGIYIS